MARIKTALAALAAASLTLAPIAAAAQDSEATSEGEDDSGVPEGSGAILAILGILGLVFLIMAITDDNNPSSP